jgi:hypothetical protein
VTDTTAARRQLLALLLDRVDRDALLEPEKPLLRALVAAEQGAADTRPTTDDDARPWIADAFGLDIETSWGVIADTARSHLRHLAATNDTIARVRELAERWAYVPGLKDSPRTSLLRALDGPSPTNDDAPSMTVDQAVDVLADDIARRAVEGGNTGQMIGLVGAGVATSEGVFCSPLVNVNCPGHTAPPYYCDRAPSHPDTQAVADQRRLFQAAAGLNFVMSDWADADGATALCRRMPTRTCLTSGSCGDQPCARFESDDPSPWLPADDLKTVTDWATTIDEQCPARYTGDSPHLTDAPGESVDYRCGRRGHGLDSDHALPQGGGVVFCWADAIAVYPLDDAPQEPQQ